MSSTLSLNLDPNSQPSPDTAPAPEMPAAFVTIGMIAANAAVFLIMSISSVDLFSPTARQVLPWGADWGPLTLSGQPWRLLTACFIHFGFVHVAMNMYCLFQVGLLTERLFGSARYLLIYLAAGIGGNILGLYVHPLTVSAGASGAVFGVYGALLAFLLVRRGALPNAVAVAVGRSAAIFIVYNFLFGLSSSTTDMTAHIGGLFMGFAAGCLMAWSLAAGPQSQQTVRALGATAVLAIATCSSYAGLPKGSPSQGEWYRMTLLGPSIVVANNDKIAYGGSATKADAESLGRRLTQIGVFNKANIIVLLQKDAGGASISIPYAADKSKPRQPWDDPATLGSLKMIGPRLASVVGGPPLTIRILDSKGELKNEVKIEDASLTLGGKTSGGSTINGKTFGNPTVVNPDTVNYSHRTTVQQARALGDALQSVGFFHNGGFTVALDRGANGPEVSFYVNDAAWDNPRTIQGFQAIGQKIAPALGGPPLTLHLIDNTRQATKDVPIE